ncbi:hypothetical protein [Streptomyces sp. ICBB 8177]|uniref:DNA polymerase Y family protein n=1 Tax=Streptomyces sp. ICBB 8177 TaxID=563922 RepID=UPI000D67AA32|nr:hypothetical protein [Streptomyces sp. ICBB 8177]PWI42321.1 hypothetical protein CK485_23715 [Streptomyces sp. ICBB 8177]
MTRASTSGTVPASGAVPPPGTATAPGADAARVLHLRFHPPAGAPALGEDVYAGLLALLGEVTPVVQALPPDAALADVRGSLRYFGRTAAELAALIRVRALARHGTDCTVGVAANPLLARMAGQSGPPGAVRVLPDAPEAVAAFLAGQPAQALDGVGSATAELLARYGLDTVGRIADAPLGTLQRLLGAAAGRRLRERARGIDPAPVTPNAPARSIGTERRFDRDELDPERQRRALLSLTDELGARLRGDRLAARSLTLVVRYADRSTTTRTRALPEATAHTAALTDAAYRMHAALGLQRARVRAVSLRAEGLIGAELASHQLALDPADERARRLEEVTDRARALFGPAAAGPAGLLGAA